MKKPVILVILDGFGVNFNPKISAISRAKTPNLDKIFSQNPTCTLEASGESVGLPAGQMGNSEVGHLTLGAGRTVFQDLVKISHAAKNGEFLQNPALVEAMEYAKKGGRKLHLMGLLSDGGVHSHIDHARALLEMAREQSLQNVYIHAFLDGRDVQPKTANKFIGILEKTLEELGVGRIATAAGRFFGMDRDNRWDRTQKAYAALVEGSAQRKSTPDEAIAESYTKSVNDEFFEPTIFDENGLIESGDVIIFWNFRSDRARQISHALLDKNFVGFNRKKATNPRFFVSMTEYDNALTGAKVAFPAEEIQNTLGECLASHGLRQLRLAETEKYAHVTFFFDGRKEQQKPGETRILMPSPKVATYDLAPEMMAGKLAEKACEAMHSGDFEAIIMNFANCDMVGHTGNFAATVRAVEAVDSCVGAIVSAAETSGFATILTADHGNAEKMLDENSEPFTAHTLAPVPFCVVGSSRALRQDGNLADVAPTFLEILELPKPPEMTGRSLFL